MRGAGSLEVEEEVSVAGGEEREDVGALRLGERGRAWVQRSQGVELVPIVFHWKG